MYILPESKGEETKTERGRYHLAALLTFPPKAAAPLSRQSKVGDELKACWVHTDVQKDVSRVISTMTT